MGDHFNESWEYNNNKYHINRGSLKDGALGDGGFLMDASQLDGGVL